MDGIEKKKDEKEERIKRMKARGAVWMTRRFMKELLLEVVDNASTDAETIYIKNIVEEVMEEAIMRSEMNKIIDSLESVGGMEPRVFTELIERDERRKKHARLARRMEKEAIWLARRKEDDRLRELTGAETVTDHQKPDPMEWEEHDLEYQNTRWHLWAWSWITCS